MYLPMSEGLFRDSCETGEPMPMNNLPVDIYKMNANVIVSIDHLFLSCLMLGSVLYSLSTLRYKAREN